MDIKCTKCLETLPESSFGSDPRKRNGKRSDCLSCQKKAFKIYRDAHKDKIKLANRKWYLENTEKAKAYATKWGEEHPELRKQYAKTSQMRHPENGRRATKKWMKANPEKHAAAQRNRRARQLQAYGTITKEDTIGLFEIFDYRCLKCGADGRKDVKLTVDHVIPLTLGGDNTIENSQPLCARCNSSKNNTIIDYRYGLGE